MSQYKDPALLNTQELHEIGEAQATQANPISIQGNQEKIEEFFHEARAHLSDCQVAFETANQVKLTQALQLLSERAGELHFKPFQDFSYEIKQFVDSVNKLDIGAQSLLNEALAELSFLHREMEEGFHSESKAYVQPSTMSQLTMSLRQFVVNQVLKGNKEQDQLLLTLRLFEHEHTLSATPEEMETYLQRINILINKMKV